MYIHLYWVQRFTPPSRLPSFARPSASCFSNPRRQVLSAVAVPPAPSTVEPLPFFACLPASDGTDAPACPSRASHEPSPASAAAPTSASTSCYPWQSPRSAAFDWLLQSQP